MYDSKLNALFMDIYTIFDGTIWATIIPTLTIKEAEQKLNCKIV